MHGACDNTLDVNALLTPLSLACLLAGTPISQSAIQNAQIQASSLALMTTVTVTQTGTNVAPSPVGPHTASGETMTTVTVTESSGPTATQILPGSTDYTSQVPVIIIGTNSAGSAYTSTATVPGAVSTITTTNSAGSTATLVSTYTQGSGIGAGSQSSASSNSGQISSITTATTRVAAQSTTGTFVTSATSTGANSESTNSSPFGVQGSADHKRASSLLGLLALGVVAIWL